MLYRGLQGRVMTALAFVTLFSVFGLGLVAYWAERDALQQQLSLELTSSVDYTKQRIQDWLDERQSDVRFLAADAANQESVWQLLSPETASEVKEFHVSRLAASLLSMQQARPEYIRIFIADAEGTILVAADPASVGQSVKDLPAFRATLQLAPTAMDEGYVEDISYNEQLNAYIMCFGYPLLVPSPLSNPSSGQSVDNGAGDGSAALGVVLITVDMGKTIYPILTEWRTGHSGTAVLSRAEGEQTRILNTVLGDPTPPLQRVLPAPATPQQAKPAHWAARGVEGAYLTMDHLGVEVLTIYRHIPEMKWGLVLKMDTSEVFAPLHKLIRHVTYIALGVLAIALLVSIVIARTLTRPLAELVNTARGVAAGKTPVYTALARRDEIGILARSFRDMVDALHHQQAQLKAANEVAGGIVGSRSIQAILTDVVQAAQRLTDAQVAQLSLHEPTTYPFVISGNSSLQLTDDSFVFASITASSGTNPIVLPHNGHAYRQRAESLIPETNEQWHAKPVDSVPGMYLSREDIPSLETARRKSSMHLEEEESIILSIQSREVEFGSLRVQKAIARSFTRADKDTLQALTTYAAVALENARLVHQLKSWNAELEQRVIERTYELEAANQRLKVLDQMKADLLCSISHELRNPITNLKLHLDLLQRHIESPRRQKYLAALVSQVDTLARLVADMLELIQLDSMQNQFVFAPVNFTMLVDDVVKSSAARLRQMNKPVTLSFEPQAKPLFVSGEQTQLALAVTHLLRNAINFTPRGTIHVQMCCEKEESCLQIQDTGIGIAQDDLPHLFERFFRGANVSQSTIPGSGLGLSVVEKIVTSHGGRVAIESQLGQGSIVRLWLPQIEAPQTLQLFTPPIFPKASR